MAFVLDVPNLFKMLIETNRDACLRNSPFDWEDAIIEMQTTCPDIMEPYLSVLQASDQQSAENQAPASTGPQNNASGGDLPRPLKGLTAKSHLSKDGGAVNVQAAMDVSNPFQVKKGWRSLQVKSKSTSTDTHGR